MAHLSIAPVTSAPQASKDTYLTGMRALLGLLDSNTALRCPAEGRTPEVPVTLPYLAGPPDRCRRDLTAAATALAGLGVTLTPAVHGGDVYYDLDGVYEGIHIRLRSWALHACDITPPARPATAA